MNSNTPKNRRPNANTIKTDIQSVANTFGTKQPALSADKRSPQRRVAEQHQFNEHNPFFYHTNTTKAHPFSLHSPPSTPTSHNTTLSLILFLHILYLYQWNRRSSRSDVATNYDQLVNKWQYWRGVLAIISHPPIEGGERFERNNSRSGSEVEEDTNNNPGRRFLAGWIVYTRIQSVLQTACAPMRMFSRVLHPLFFGHLSGLPLLAYVSHILWQCRALEEVYNEHSGSLLLGVQSGGEAAKFSGMASQVVVSGSDRVTKMNLMCADGNCVGYFRVLVALATTSILLEISLLRAILRRMDRHMDFTGYSTTPRTLLSQRAICSLTSLSAAVLSVYDTMFPYASPPVLPFVGLSFLDSSAFSLLFSIMILCILAHRIHPVTSVVSGLLSGSLWALGVTSFLGTRYWSNVMFGTLIGAILLSLKPNPRWSIYLGLMLPCLDYVAWDGDGNIRDPNASNMAENSRFGSSQTESNLDEMEMGQSSYLESNDIADYSSPPSTSLVERRPLLSHDTDSSLSNGSSFIRGRVPLINSMVSDLDDGSSAEAANNATSRLDGNLSRRGRGV